MVKISYILKSEKKNVKIPHQNYICCRNTLLMFWNSNYLFLTPKEIFRIRVGFFLQYWETKIFESNTQLISELFGLLIVPATTYMYLRTETEPTSLFLMEWFWLETRYIYSVHPCICIFCNIKHFKTWCSVSYTCYFSTK